MSACESEDLFSAPQCRNLMGTLLPLANEITGLEKRGKVQKSEITYSHTLSMSFSNQALVVHTQPLFYNASGKEDRQDCFNLPGPSSPLTEVGISDDQ
jgi:hypothetical protein